MNNRLFLHILLLLILVTGCNQKNNSDDASREKSLDNLIENPQEDGAEFIDNESKFTDKELTRIMDSLNNIIGMTSVRHNLQSWWVDESKNRVIVNMIVCNKEKIAEFKQSVMNSPAILFEEVEDVKPEGIICDSCGFGMKVLPHKLKLPVSKLKIKITNNNEGEGMTGELFFIERFDGNNWKAVPLNYTFNSIGYMMKARKTWEIGVNLQPEVYDYKEGKYRIYKQVLYNKEHYILTAEFIIE